LCCVERTKQITEWLAARGRGYCGGWLAGVAGSFSPAGDGGQDAVLMILARSRAALDFPVGAERRGRPIASAAAALSLRFVTRLCNCWRRGRWLWLATSGTFYTLFSLGRWKWMKHRNGTKAANLTCS
jgi:hypothetical protein